jgi:parvulin-like peptidyl-prolyl isomerase
MKRACQLRQIYCMLILCVLVPPGSHVQQVIDRIVARIENDVILLSDVRLLSRYQLFVDGKSESDAEILDRLIDQWIVRNEANVARTPKPSEAEIDRALQRLEQSFDSKDDYEARRKLAGLSEADVRRLIADQLYLNNYLDTRFRASVQVNEQAIEAFYQNALLPRAKARGQNPPSLDAAHDYVQEALVQAGINEQADRWLNESRARIHVTKMLGENES